MKRHFLSGLTVGMMLVGISGVAKEVAPVV